MGSHLALLGTCSSWRTSQYYSPLRVVLTFLSRTVSSFPSSQLGYWEPYNIVRAEPALLPHKAEEVQATWNEFNYLHRKKNIDRKFEPKGIRTILLNKEKAGFSFYGVTFFRGPCIPSLLIYSRTISPIWNIWVFLRWSWRSSYLLPLSLLQSLLNSLMDPLYPPDELPSSVLLRSAVSLKSVAVIFSNAPSNKDLGIYP